MNYGYFDDEKREYVITRPDTPAPWANYLGSPEYGAIISNNAGGYSFVKSGANGRITRYQFNQEDKPGRYIYLRDNDDADYWSASWQPVGKDLTSYKNTCRHGTAYTIISSDYHKIHSEALYYVPLNQSHEVWRVKVTNQDNQKRNLSVFGYIEFTNQDYYENDQVNLQYSLFITKTYFQKNKILQAISENDKKGCDGSNHLERFFGLAKQKVSTYCGDKSEFLGAYHSYSNPISVERGYCNDELNYNSNSCGALETKLILEPGETKELIFLLGRKTETEANQLIQKYEATNRVDQELEELKDYWHNKLSHLIVHTPDENFNHMVNTWNAYQCFITFTWSRAASFYYCGLRNGYGYRDTVQDIQGIIALDPDMAKERIRFMLSAQVNHGGGLPLVKFTHNPGHEDTPEDASYVQATGHPAYRADDALWLFPTIFDYLGESGDLAFLDEVIPFANKDCASVYEHLKRAISFSMEHLGLHNLPAGLHADWNDCLRLGAKGESVFVSFQLYYAISILKTFADYKKDYDYITYLEKIQTELGTTIQTLCWNQDRFIRGFTEDGAIIGSRDAKEANMWLNPQSFSVISGLAKKEQAELALDTVYRELNTSYGVRLMAPAFKDHGFPGALAILYNPSTKENGAIFSQTQGWIILAEALLGHGNRAFLYFTESCPATLNDHAEVRVMEPYVHGQFTESIDSPHNGRSHVHWLTGTASTVMVGCVEGILGLRSDLFGLTIAPSIPSSWREVTIQKIFRKKKLTITIHNEHQKESGYEKLYLNHELMERNYIKADDLKEVNEIELFM